jgi:NAD(P)-dependent dehydrogenase (short-subunit alcohol dehydrogenase family)
MHGRVGATHILNGPTLLPKGERMRLDGKVAIVTGASRGIGRAISRGLAAYGARVVVASRTEVDRSHGSPHPKYASGTIFDTANAIEEAGGIALPVRCDVSQAADVEHLVQATLERFGRLDIVVANAGVDCESPVVELDLDLLDRCLAVNVRGPLLLCKYALAPLIAQGVGGSVFCITSGAAQAYRPGRVGYSMSKAALERMFLNLAEEVRPHNIAVNVLDPGRVDTWMNRNGDWPGTAHIPMAQPDVMIPAAVWLAQQTAETWTGQVVKRAEFSQTWGC